mmetsp:Transcript_27801/g.60817  ORF Transcript_27801/g.60817 Transcript_27801/m.60817 type:complete len:211 (-) Transcript_27801:1479-2111(-)
MEHADDAGVRAVAHHDAQHHGCQVRPARGGRKLQQGGSLPPRVPGCVRLQRARHCAPGGRHPHAQAGARHGAVCAAPDVHERGGVHRRLPPPHHPPGAAPRARTGRGGGQQPAPVLPVRRHGERRPAHGQLRVSDVHPDEQGGPEKGGSAGGGLSGPDQAAPPGPQVWSGVGLLGGDAASRHGDARPHDRKRCHGQPMSGDGRTWQASLL